MKLSRLILLLLLLLLALPGTSHAADLKVSATTRATSLTSNSLFGLSKVVTGVSTGTVAITFDDLAKQLTGIVGTNLQGKFGVQNMNLEHTPRTKARLQARLPLRIMFMGDDAVNPSGMIREKLGEFMQSNGHGLGNDAGYYYESQDYKTGTAQANSFYPGYYFDLEAGNLVTNINGSGTSWDTTTVIVYGWKSNTWGNTVVYTNTVGSARALLGTITGDNSDDKAAYSTRWDFPTCANLVVTISNTGVGQLKAISQYNTNVDAGYSISMLTGAGIEAGTWIATAAISNYTRAFLAADEIDLLIIQDQNATSTSNSIVQVAAYWESMIAGLGINLDLVYMGPTPSSTGANVALSTAQRAWCFTNAALFGRPLIDTFGVFEPATNAETLGLHGRFGAGDIHLTDAGYEVIGQLTAHWLGLDWPANSNFGYTNSTFASSFTLPSNVHTQNWNSERFFVRTNGEFNSLGVPVRLGGFPGEENLYAGIWLLGGSSTPGNSNVALGGYQGNTWVNSTTNLDFRLANVNQARITDGRIAIRGSLAFDYNGAFGAASPTLQIVANTPEGQISAPPGSLALRIDGGAGGPLLYGKETGTGNTGWGVISDGTGEAQSPWTSDIDADERAVTNTTAVTGPRDDANYTAGSIKFALSSDKGDITIAGGTNVAAADSEHGGSITLIGGEGGTGSTEGGSINLTGGYGVAAQGGNINLTAGTGDTFNGEVTVTADLTTVTSNLVVNGSISSGAGQAFNGNGVNITNIPALYEFALSDETTAITTGQKLSWRAPFPMTITAIRASLTTASSSGAPVIDVEEGGTTIFSTALTIDASEKTSTTAATAAVMSDTALADDAEITFDVDTAGTGAAGLKIKIYYRR